jgi:hypothetical protein
MCVVRCCILLPVERGRYAHFVLTPIHLSLILSVDLQVHANFGRLAVAKSIVMILEIPVILGPSKLEYLGVDC